MTFWHYNLGGRGGGGVLGGEFHVPPLLYEILHAHNPGIPLFVAAFMREEINPDVSTTQLFQYVELCTSAGNSHTCTTTYESDTHTSRST